MANPCVPPLSLTLLDEQANSVNAGKKRCKPRSMTSRTGITKKPSSSLNVHALNSARSHESAPAAQYPVRNRLQNNNEMVSTFRSGYEKTAAVYRNGLKQAKRHARRKARSALASSATALELFENQVTGTLSFSNQVSTALGDNNGTAVCGAFRNSSKGMVYCALVFLFLHFELLLIRTPSRQAAAQS